jgi:hypothetical protein
MRLLIGAAALGLTFASPAFAENRCGWISNPTPGNWWLTDADDTWTIMEQGSEGAPGMDKMPDFTENGRWVEVNGSYGYGCACFDMDVNPQTKRVTQIYSARSLPLSKCKRDPNLPGQ